MRIKTPSRLHIALIDLNGSSGRVDGGVGLCIDKPNFVMRSELADNNSASSGRAVALSPYCEIEFAKTVTDKEAIEECLEKIPKAAELTAKRYNINEKFHFTIEETYPAHSGLGSGTQIALATAKLMTESIGEHVDSVTLGDVISRGGTSGIGVHGFDKGGMIVDGGHSMSVKKTFLPSSASHAAPPCLIGRYDFPDDWKVMAIFPKFGKHIAGAEEVSIFQNYCPLPMRDVERVSYLVFMNLLPCVLDADIEGFGKAIDEIQAVSFNKIELTIQPPEITKAMNDIRDLGAYGVGLSSFGPTLFSVYNSDNKDILGATRDLLGDSAEVLSVNVSKSGAKLSN